MGADLVVGITLGCVQAERVVVLPAGPGCVEVEVSGGSVLEAWSSSILNRGSVCLGGSTIGE